MDKLFLYFKQFSFLSWAWFHLELSTSFFATNHVSQHNSIWFVNQSVTSNLFSALVISKQAFPGFDITSLQILIGSLCLLSVKAFDGITSVNDSPNDPLSLAAHLQVHCGISCLTEHFSKRYNFLALRAPSFAHVSGCLKSCFISLHLSNKIITPVNVFPFPESKLLTDWCISNTIQKMWHAKVASRFAWFLNQHSCRDTSLPTVGNAIIQSRICGIILGHWNDENSCLCNKLRI